jgi:hypothetical protein
MVSPSDTASPSRIPITLDLPPSSSPNSKQQTSPEMSRQNDQNVEWDDASEENRMSPLRRGDLIMERKYQASKKIPTPMKYPRKFTLDACRVPVSTERDEWVVLNVGGKRYETYVSTLRSYPSK